MQANLGNMIKKVKTPSVSIVMGVRNAESTIEKTISSILNQANESLELIIVNDGSTDSTETIIRKINQEDNRIKCVTRKNKGLTISLIEGCELAQGEFIARHDANDLSVPGRINAQVDALRDNRKASFCSTFVRHVTREGVGALVTTYEGIIHGSVMMRKSAYLQVGGYRSQFYYAQDIDLWSRLEEVGDHIVIPKIYYEALLYPESISGTKGGDQRKFFNIITKASNARKKKENEEVWLNRAYRLSQRCRNQKTKKESFADGAYFIGSCLSEHNPTLAKKYFQEAIRFNGLHLRSHLRLAGMR